MATLLCIEDDRQLLEILTEELTDDGHEVLQAGDGSAGLEMILEHDPDLVISDISMPVMDGYELLKKLREQHPNRTETPFIFLSALADRKHVIDGLGLGADDYLTKPIDYDMLAVRVETRLRQNDRMLKKKEADVARLVECFENIGAKAVESTEDLIWK
jgi:DNA-binding response OmpR family regulator